jgi:YHS domain-containing protein
MKKYFVPAALLVLFSCHQADNKTAASAAKTDTTAASQETDGVLASLKNLPFAYNRDPSCGMPLKAGLEDTTTYKGKLYGFCSKDCKDAFLKDPAGYTAKIK